MICVACAVSVLFFYDRHEACTYRLKVIETENGNGYGYQILCGDRVVICQPYIPSLPERKGFALEEDARKVGNLVLERIKRPEGAGNYRRLVNRCFRIHSKLCSR